MDSERTWSPALLASFFLIYLLVLGGVLHFTGIVDLSNTVRPFSKALSFVFGSGEKEPVADSESQDKGTDGLGSGEEGDDDRFIGEKPSPNLNSPTVAPSVVTDSFEEIRTNQKLAKMYSAMEPASAAFIFESMVDDQVIAILSQMKEQAAADILAIFPAERAAAITAQIQGTDDLLVIEEEPPLTAGY